MMLTLLLVALVAANGVMSQSRGSGKWTASDFGEMDTWINTNNYIYHLEEDLYVPGNILYSEYNAMKTSDGSGTPTTLRTGTLYTFSFVQLNSSSVILSMWNFYTLTNLNRANNQLDVFVGTTGAGYQDGKTTPKFNGLMGIVHKSGMLYVVEYNNKAVRSVDVNSKVVSTVYDGTELGNPRSLLISDDGMFLYVLSINNKIITIQLGGCDSPATVIHQTSAVFKSPEKFVFLSPDIVVVAQPHQLVVFDYRTEEVSYICTNAASYTDGPYDKCTMHTPYGLLLRSSDSKLYIGQYLRIRSIETPRAVNECQENLDDCRRTEDCTDTRYGWDCSCKDGFESDLGCCYDINECDDSNQCSSGEQCINTTGSFVCK